MASNNVFRGEKGAKSRRQLSNLRSVQNVHLGFVRGTDDPQRMGRLLVWVPELGPDIAESYITVSYASPFAGVTNIDANQGNFPGIQPRNHPLGGSTKGLTDSGFTE